MSGDMSYTGTMTAILVGRPADLPEESRMCQVPPQTEKVKVPFRNGYEHYQQVDARPEAGRRVFCWTGSTRIAE